jgi:phenylacetate-CoA ligase
MMNKATCTSLSTVKEKNRDEALKALVERLWSRVTPYRRKMEEAGMTAEDVKGLDDLASLPFTTKEDLRENYPLGLLACARRDVVRVHASSGTTGKPTVVAYTERDIATWSDMMAHRLAVAGVTDEDVFQVILGYGLFTGALGFHWGAERLGSMVVPAGGGFTERQLLLMEDLATTVFTSTPSYALHLAEVIAASDLADRLSLRLGIFGAEAWTEEMRCRIEEGLGIVALDSYGLSEVIGPGVAMECPERSGLHFDPGHFLIEIVDPETGEVLPEGVPGEVVITTLTKEALPVIRYRTRDLSRLLGADCPCGCGEPRLERIKGRCDDMLIIRGVNVFPSQIEIALSRVEGLALHYQLQVVEEGTMKELKVVCETEFPLSSEAVASLARKAVKSIQTVTTIRSEVELLPPGTLERNGGKALRVLRGPRA